jgi:tetratricopeptide (TPR) repeat protein
LTAAELWAGRGCERADPSRQAAAQLLLAGVALDQGKKTGERRHFELAREQYAAILADCPRHVVAGNNLAWLLVTNLADPDGALTVAEQVRGPASLDTLHPDFLGTLLRVYRQTRRWAKAQAVLDAAVRAAPDRPSLQLELGLYHAATNNPAIARDVLRQALHSGLDAEQRREAQHWISTL